MESKLSSKNSLYPDIDIKILEKENGKLAEKWLKVNVGNSNVKQYEMWGIDCLNMLLYKYTNENS